MIASSIEVRTGKPYKVHIGHGLLDEVGVMLSVLHRPCQAMVVSDTNVAPL